MASNEIERVLPHVVSPNEPTDDEHLVWLMQNDDHPFVDADEEVWRAGLAAMCSHRAAFKSMYPTHWADALQLALKFQQPRRFGPAYVGSKLTQTDAVQVMNRPS